MDYGSDMGLSNSYASYISGARANIRAHNELMDEQILQNKAQLKNELTQETIGEAIGETQKGIGAALSGVGMKGKYEKLNAIKQMALEKAAEAEDWVGKDIMNEIRGDLPRARRGGVGEIVARKRSTKSFGQGLKDHIGKKLKAEADEVLGESGQKAKQSVKGLQEAVEKSGKDLGESVENVTAKSTEAVKKAEQSVQSIAQETEQQVREGLADAKETLGETQASLKSTAKKAVDGATGMSEEASEELGALRSRSKALMRATTNQASERAGEAVARIQEASAEVGETGLKLAETGSKISPLTEALENRETLDRALGKSGLAVYHDVGGGMRKGYVTESKSTSERIAETFGDDISEEKALTNVRKIGGSQGRAWRSLRRGKKISGLGKFETLGRKGYAPKSTRGMISNLEEGLDFGFSDAKTGVKWGGAMGDWRHEILTGSEYQPKSEIASLSEHLKSNEALGETRTALAEQGEEAGSLLNDAKRGGEELVGNVGTKANELVSDVSVEAEKSLSKAGSGAKTRLDSTLGVAKSAQDQAQEVADNVRDVGLEAERSAEQMKQNVKIVGDKAKDLQDAFEGGKEAILSKGKQVANMSGVEGMEAAKNAVSDFDKAVSAGEMGEEALQFQRKAKNLVGRTLVKGAGALGVITAVAGGGMAFEHEFMSEGHQNLLQHVSNYGAMAAAGMELGGMALGATPIGAALEMGGAAVATASSLIGGGGDYLHHEADKKDEIAQTEAMNKEAEENKMRQVGQMALGASGAFASGHSHASNLIQGSGHF